MSFATPSDEFVYKIYTFDLVASATPVSFYVADQLPQDREIVLSGKCAAYAATSGALAPTLEVRLYGALRGPNVVPGGPITNLADTALGLGSHVVLGWLSSRRPLANVNNTSVYVFQPAAPVIGRTMTGPWTVGLANMPLTTPPVVTGGITGADSTTAVKVQIQLKTGGFVNDNTYVLAGTPPPAPP